MSVDLSSDPRQKKEWKQYSLAIERTLQSFDSVNEWADFITFLAKLLKSLQAYPHFPVIPHKLTVAKRLAQCLNPALPTGVHQRALDVYVHILTAIGPDNLHKDLQAWSSGLFPFFQYAATSVKPIVLGIYSKFYLPLQEHLRPATKAFILALLPGLEEDTGEFFDKVSSLLDQLSGPVSPSFFLQNIWLVLITAPSSRIAALNYLARRMLKIAASDSLCPIVGDDVGLMIRGYAAALEDQQILVQRGILDLILTTLRLDGHGFQFDTRYEDRLLLMKAITGVVLRRDLSLSRRLYSWLLGDSETAEDQIKYLRAHGLDLLAKSLKDDMHSQPVMHGDSSELQKPFKIFISLLDKWEIGSTLTNALILDTLRSLKRAMNATTVQDDLVLAANMLVEAVDPYILWKCLFRAICDDLESEDQSSETIQLAIFVVSTFRLSDEETLRVHFPTFIFAFIEILANKMDTLDTARIQLLADLAQNIFHAAAESFFAQLSIDKSLQDSINIVGLQAAIDLYSDEHSKQVLASSTTARALPNRLALLTAGLTTLLSLSARCAQLYADVTTTSSHAAYIAVTKLLHCFTSALERGPSSGTFQIEWQPQKWLQNVLSALAKEDKDATFAFTTIIVESLVSMSDSCIAPNISLPSAQAAVCSIFEKLLDHLQTSQAQCHLETVALIWRVQESTHYRYLESTVCSRLTSKNLGIREAAFEAFGNLWRLTDDSHLPSVHLRIPMFIMLDALRSEKLFERRAGEAWMRCSLKSYLRVLDPMLSILVDPSLLRKTQTLKIGTHDIEVLKHQKAFDAARMAYILDNLLNLARFGGQGLTRIAKAHMISSCPDPLLRDYLKQANLGNESYLGALCQIMISVLRSEPSSSKDVPIINHVQTSAADLLQVIISRGELDATSLQAIESALVSRLLLAIHRSESDIQNKLLHVLHSTIQALSAFAKKTDRKRSASEASHTKEQESASTASIAPHDARLVDLLCQAVNQQRDTALVHHWIDFILMTIPTFRTALQSFILPLLECINTRLQAFVEEVGTAYALNGSKGKGVATNPNEADFAIILNALERLLILAVEEAKNAPNQLHDNEPVQAAAAAEGTGIGLFGYVSTVLGATEDSPVLPSIAPLELSVQAVFSQATKILLQAADIATRLGEEHNQADSFTETRYHLAEKLQTRASKALERLYKSQPADTLKSIVEVWHADQLSSNDDILDRQTRLFATLDTITPSAQIIASLVCDQITSSISALSEKAKSTPTAIQLVYFEFLEAYFDRLEGPIAVQVWPPYLTLAKDIAQSHTLHKYRLLPALRCFTVLSERVAHTSALEDRRMRRDLHDTFLKLVDLVSSTSNRYGDFTRRATLDVHELQLSASTDSISHAEKEKDDAIDEKQAVLQSHADAEAKLVNFFARRIVPGFRRFMIDNDRIATSATNIVYYIVSPAFKSRSRSFDADPNMLELLTELTKTPAATKSWRNLVNEIFADNRFFNAPPSIHAKWSFMVQALINSDKERFVDLIARVSTTPSANIFTNRELEALSRALSLRRLSYTIFTGEQNRFLVHLPAVQEKVVDLLRASVGDVVHSEVYLCLRVLLCRIGHQHLSSFWPIILTELLRLFETLMDAGTVETNEYLQLILSACKFLDLLLVLQTEEFQIHQWMFVTDTVDAVYHPASWTPHAIMDRLSEIINARNKGKLLEASVPLMRVTSSEQFPNPASRLRKPLLGSIRQNRMDSVQVLAPFFSRVSLSSYEAVYARGEIDWAAVEKSIEYDIFEGAE